MNTLSPLVHCNYEHVPLALFTDSTLAAQAVAAEIATLIRTRQQENRSVVIGLATGSTPISLYSELVRLHREENLSFSNVVTFNLDEYYPISPGHPQSYRQFMCTHLFDHVDLAPQNINLLSGSVSQAEIDAHCRAYEDKIYAAGGIDLQILGIGRTGHIGFNEPGSSEHSRTRLVTLDPLTRRDAAGDFGGEEQTPRYALSMGVRSILDASRVVLMAWGHHKAGILRCALEQDISTRVTASFLQQHENALFVLDQPAAGALTRVRTPWLLGPLEDQGLAWNERMTRRAILWLSDKKKKAILKITDDDYNGDGLQDLIRIHGSAYEINRFGFYDLQHTITGWPGGRDPMRTQPGDAPARPLRAPSAEVFPKRVLVLSPHPHDNVTSMGGTLCRLVEHGHEVDVAYQFSCSGAVSDEALWRAMSFVRDAGLADGTNGVQVKALCSIYEASGSLPLDGIHRHWKGIIRHHEAKAAARICGVSPARLHFLDMSFNRDNAVRDRQLNIKDVTKVQNLLNSSRPHLIYTAGNLDDPDGTYGICLHTLCEALTQCAGAAWL